MSSLWHATCGMLRPYWRAGREAKILFLGLACMLAINMTLLSQVRKLGSMRNSTHYLPSSVSPPVAISTVTSRGPINVQHVISKLNLAYASIDGKHVFDEKKGDKLKDRFLTIVVLTWERYQSLSRLLLSLVNSDYGDDLVNLEIHVDGGSGERWEKSISTAKEFEWKFGEKQVVVARKNSGLAHAWLSAWDPDVSKTKFAMILEDDLEVSRIWYKWTKLMWSRYENVSNIAGVSLQHQTFCAAKGNHKPIVNAHQPFAYKLKGSWGFSPHPRHWREFLNIDFLTLDPSVKGLVTSSWFKTYKEGSVWTQYFNWFAEKFDLYTVHLNPSDTTALAINHKEPGEHFKKKEAPDFQLANKWIDAWNPPAVLTYHDWNCDPISTSAYLNISLHDVQGHLRKLNEQLPKLLEGGS